ncbi:MAG: hypothetical protein JST30_10145 [Armatimonadetes bacterium]|nr:hypothetical protein [Armatimonadota bacterium]
MPVTATGQVALPAGPDKPQIGQNEIGGRIALEQLRYSVERPSLPLRYGNVKVGSDRVETGGQNLVRDKDYYVDYAAGVVYLKRPFRDGQTVTVEYRYDDTKGAAGTYGLVGNGAKFQGFTFAVNPNTSMILGLGLTERLADGTVLQSNVYGLKNSFSFAGGNMRGLYMVGDRKRVQSENMFGEKARPGTNDEEGKSHAIVQQFDGSVMGGKVRLGYQDIGDKFGGFSAFEGSGIEDAQIRQFAKERGLKRTDLAVEGLGGKALGLSAGMRSVGDDQGTVNWRNYGGNLFGLAVNYSALKVDPGFARFKDLAEGDRDQLAKERGLDRQNVSVGKTWKTGGLKYDTTKVETLDGFGLYRQAFAFNLPWVSASFSNQHVQQGFNRFGDLREGDRGQLARESGLVRQNTAFSLAPKGGFKLNWSDAVVRTDGGDFVARGLGLNYGRLSFSHDRLDVGPGFGALGALSPQEIGSHLNTIVKMADPNAGVQGPDGGAWGNSAGLNRSVWRAGYDFGKGSSLATSSEAIEGANDQLKVRQVALVTPKVSMSLRDQRTGDEFGETTRLLLTEQQRFGTAIGLQRSDFNLAANLGGMKNLKYSRTTAEDQGGDLSRQMLSFADKGFSVNYNRRSVGAGFASLPGMVDPERDFLTAMVGFDQSELTASWQLMPSLALEFRDVKGFNATNGFGRFGSLAAIRWLPDKNTTLTGASTSTKQTDPSQPLVDQRTDRIELSRNMGAVGKLTLMHEERQYEGSQDVDPDSRTDTVVYENQLTKSTTLRTEHSKTLFENGEHETKTSNSVSQALNSRLGVSVTDTKIQREGDKPSVTQRDYGFWVDFGKNIRLNYKSVRNLNGQTEGELHNDVNVTPGEVQGVSIGAAQYQSNVWDDKRDQSIGNVSLSNVKPLRFGFLQDVRFNYAVNSVRDMDAWQREFRTMGFGARIGAFAFGVDYKSQSLPDGDRAIDRVFSFTTDVTGKSKIRADVKYNLRTLPFGQQAMIRNYTVTAEPIKHWQITHSLNTNPLQADNNALLGAVATPTRSNKWGVSFDGNAKTKFGMGYEEFYNEQNNQQISSLKFGATLFANNPSPLVLEYVTAESNVSGEMQRSHGFNLRFDQRPGPNQSMSLKLSNLNWEIARPSDQNLQNWNLRFDYSWKF